MRFYQQSQQQQSSTSRVEVLPSSSDDEENATGAMPQQAVAPEQPAPAPTTADPMDLPSDFENFVADVVGDEHNPDDLKKTEGDTAAAGAATVAVTKVDAARAAAYKAKGNALYAEQKYERALRAYRCGLRFAALRPRPPPPAPLHSPAAAEAGLPSATGDATTADGADATSTAAPATQQPTAPSTPTPSVAELAAWQLRAQLHCNAAQILITQELYDDALLDLDEAIRHDDTYARAYQRRGFCHFKLERWAGAHADFEKTEQLVEAAAPGSANKIFLDAAFYERKRTAKAKVDEEMAKMWGQLKDLGNMFLGKFGMSTDNFKFDKDPNTGGYSMRFER
jgi:tetratricopeptide (TPR) repeat protein